MTFSYISRRLYRWLDIVRWVFWQGRPASRLVLVQVDRNIDMVDQDKVESIPKRSTGEFKAFIKFYDIK